MWTEFKEFAVRGNVIDLAVAVVIGAAFGKVVSSLVENIMTPIFSLFLDVVDVSYLTLTIADTDIFYGMFIQSILDFVLISMATFFLIRMINRFRRENEKEAETGKNKQEQVLKEIRDLLKEKHPVKPTAHHQKLIVHISGKRYDPRK
ncbi:large conductance mechanosensitive channel protein MscL [Lentibacillus saliphilus]|uniref:large conductance mechanosensitive channel protein MscL n=1 Tax=Lentibacillus saliphilus TaxID=2737028 RepID=UPI001C30EB93|nr:large conductance mechanosensitive channel protein MscL [Lentibacillus saliphilus]